MKTILFDFDNAEQMDAKEAELVPLSCCYPYDKSSYNLRAGGIQGHMTERTKGFLQQRRLDWWKDKDEDFKREWGRKMSRPGINNGMYGKKLRDYMSEDAYAEMCRKKADKSRARANDPKWLAKMSEVTRGENNGMYGKKLRDYMTQEAYDKLCAIRSSLSKGEKNSMFGKNVKDHMSKEAYVKMLENRRKAMAGRKDMTCDGVHCKKVKP